MASLNALLLSLNEPVFEADLEGLLISATPALHEMLGLHPSEHSTILAGFAEDDRGQIAQALKRVAEGKVAAAIVEARTAGEDGMGIAVEMKLVPVNVEGGKPTGICGWVRDISAAQESERQATVQGTHLFNLVEHVDDACVVESVEGLVETLNAAFCRLFSMNVAPQSLIGVDVAEVFDQARAASGSKKGPVIAQGEGTSDAEYQVGGKAVKQRAFPIKHDGMPLGQLYLFKTTEKHSPQAEAVQTTSAQLEHVERIAREIAITVESAGSAIHRAEQLHLPAAIIEYFQRVETSARTAFTAIGGLLDFSKFEPGELKSLKLDKSEFNLRDALAGLVEHVAALAEDKQLQLRLRVEQDVPLFIKGDAARLMLVLRNLLECIVAATDAGTAGASEVGLVVATEYASEGKVHLNFSLEASSAGKAAKLRAYAPIGLMQIAVARQLVKAMGADIQTLHRKDASGMAFAVAFPSHDKKEPKVRPKFLTLTGLPALIVSADAAQRHELATLMRSWRMLPYEADNATMAIQLLLRQEAEGKPIPLVIVSNDLPIQDGFLLAFRIKNHAKLRHTLVMMLAKSGKPGDATACRENGIAAYLRHPVSDAQLNEAIMAVAGVSEGKDSDATHTLITRHSLRESRRATILLIDQDRETQIAAGNIVRKRGYMLTEAEDAEQAIDALEEEVYDLILVDTATPGLEDATKSLRSLIQKNADTVIIVAISDDASEKNRKKCEKSGFDGFLAKPLEKESLLALLAAKFPERAAAE
jgi:PAS domain S-box-containing protein